MADGGTPFHSVIFLPARPPASTCCIQGRAFPMAPYPRDRDRRLAPALAIDLAPLGEGDATTARSRACSGGVECPQDGPRAALRTFRTPSRFWSQRWLLLPIHSHHATCDSYRGKAPAGSDSLPSPGLKSFALRRLIATRLCVSQDANGLSA